MKKISIGVFGVFVFTILSCKSAKQAAANSQASETIFPKGEKITNNNFIGNAWLQLLVSTDSSNNISIGNVTFEPGARTNWLKGIPLEHQLSAIGARPNASFIGSKYHSSSSSATQLSSSVEYIINFRNFSSAAAIHQQRMCMPQLKALNVGNLRQILLLIQFI